MKRLAAIAVSLAAAGCTPMQWVKADATPEQLSQDALQCQQDAWREARLRTWYYRPYAPMIARDAAGRAFVIAPGPFYDPFSDPFMEESRLAQFCMRSKGYSLEPADTIQPSPSGYIERDGKPKPD